MDDNPPQIVFGTNRATGETFVQAKCQRPPAGWYCTRPANHDGPCAAHPAEAAAPKKKPTIAELEAILESGRNLEVCIAPNGEVTTRAKEETGWVIERGNPAAPEYFTGQQGVQEVRWSLDHQKALRLARKVDAEIIVDNVLYEGNTRVAEHAWS